MIMNNYLNRFHDKELWKEVSLKPPFDIKFELYISNYGNVKRINKITNVEVVMNQSFTENYPSSNFATVIPMTEKESLDFIEIRTKISNLLIKIKEISEAIKFELETEKKEQLTLELEELEAEHLKIKTIYSKKSKKSQSKRRKTFSFLVHRLVAIAFVKKASDLHNLVAHLDYNKENNHHSNLKWMTRAENVLHQKNSPLVIKSKIIASEKKDKVTRSKLTISQVMILKKRLNEGIALRDLSKRFKVTQTQLLRIKRGENWAKVPAAL